jgi:DNA-directed RNA polymerase subunit A'
MSIMAHRVRVTPWKTFTLNLCTCPPYNADFDGDEMNLHVPQTEEARAEAELLMEVQKHIRSPRFGGPIIGCVEDHISGCFKLTRKETVLTREEAFKLLAEVGVIPNLRDKKSFSGKEVFSHLLPKGLYIEFKTKSNLPGDDYVVIKNGELKSGVIDSKAISKEHGRLIDVIEKEFGTEQAHRFIDSVSLLGIKYLDKTGFTIGLNDIELDNDTRKEISGILEDAEKEVGELIKLYEEGKIEVLPGCDLRESLEAHILEVLSKATEKMESIVRRSIGDNCATVMAKSGARASLAHLTQLAAAVGQARILGERIHRGYRDRTLSIFPIGDLSPAAHGFIKNGFKSGLNPYEFFFDAVSGRESLMDKSLRTRHSGYLERRLMNALQDLKIEYDYTVRDNRGVIIQFTPGEDKIDPSKSDWGFLDVDSIIQSVVR